MILLQSIRLWLIVDYVVMPKKIGLMFHNCSSSYTNSNRWNILKFLNMFETQARGDHVLLMDSGKVIIWGMFSCKL